MIDPFHLEATGKTAVNYNRDIEIYPVLEALFTSIYGESPYKSPTDMGVNMVGFCISDDEAVREASKQEIIRRQKLQGIVLFPRKQENRALLAGAHLADNPHTRKRHRHSSN